MGILTDFVIAESGAGQKIGESINPSDEWPTFQAKGIETVKLASLYCAITEKPYHNDIQKSFLLVGGDKEEGPWVFEFPSEILGCIAGVEAEQIEDVAKAWASTDELRLDRWSVDDASWVVRKLADHASKAVESCSSMYLWLSV